MMTTDRIDAPLPFTLKKERTACNDSDGDNNLDVIDNFLSVSWQSLSMNNSVIVDESNDFLCLTTMVRDVYLSHLYKCLLSNYITCHRQKDDDIPSVEMKKYAYQMELHAVRLALEARLYRQNMLKMIADIKSHTVKKKAYKKLLIFLETPKDRIDIAIQTDDTQIDLHRVNTIQSGCITSNFEKTMQTASPTINSSSFYESGNVMTDIEDETDAQILQETIKEESNDASQEAKDQIEDQIMDDITTIRNEDEIMDDITTIKNEDENSQDSLLQNMKDMFCESDDSSDLTKLIEKHSGVTKANIDKEINKICLEADIIAGSNFFGVSQSNNISRPNVATVNTNEKKVSFSRYKEMQNRKAAKLKGINETVESKQKQRINATWFVERVHQVSKLKTKMTELSLNNYRKHGRIKEKFLRLFGEFEGEEMMPDSPICIEDHLPACKERIAPWIVKYLMPFYKKRRIKDRQLFKAVAKHIADMLIIEKTFPEQECVSKYIEGYFKNKRFIKTKQDIY